MRANRKALMSRSAASIAAEWPTSARPAAATASGLVDLRFGDPPAALADRVLDEAGDDAPGQFVDRARLLEAGMEVVDLPHQAVDEGNGGAKLGEREQARAQAVVDVVGVIGDIVSDRRRLRLEARMEAEVERLHLDRKRGSRPGRRAPGSARSARRRRSSSGPLCLTSPASVGWVRLRPSKSA